MYKTNIPIKSIFWAIAMIDFAALLSIINIPIQP